MCACTYTSENFNEKEHAILYIYLYLTIERTASSKCIIDVQCMYMYNVYMCRGGGGITNATGNGFDYTGFVKHKITAAWCNKTL